MRRRDLVTLIGAAAVAPVRIARAQQAQFPVIGFLHSGSPGPFAKVVAAFREGLREAGYVPGQNVRVDFRWANLSETNLSEANLTGADFRRANLQKAIVAGEQLKTARSLAGATMPDGTKHN